MVSSTTKTDGHDFTEILLKVVLNTITLTLTHYHFEFDSHRVVLDTTAVYEISGKPGDKVYIKFALSILISTV
jgi:hypothetical protein